MRTPDVAIVIAAGGDGVRMGGAKPARLLAGRRLIDFAVAWALQNSEVVALAVRTGDTDWGTGLPMLVDRHADVGPISALASAFRFALMQQRPLVMLISCDLPFLPPDLAGRLKAAIPGHCVAMPVCGGRRHPMAAMWKPDVRPIEAYIAGGGQSLWRFAQSAGLTEVNWRETPDPFLNINQPSDLAAAEQRLKMQEL